MSDASKHELHACRELSTSFLEKRDFEQEAQIVVSVVKFKKHICVKWKEEEEEEANNQEATGFLAL